MRQQMRITGPDSLGRLIQQARLSAGQTQAELAAELGISQRSVTEIETGKATIQMRRLFELMKLTGVKITGEWETSDD